MRARTQPAAFCLALLLTASTAPLRADDLAEKGRAIFEKYQQSVVTVQVLVRSSFSVPGRNTSTNESLHSVSGTVLTPTGLTVLSLSATDPGQALQRMAAGQDPRFKVETELTDIIILRDDGTRVPAEVLLRDNDLDLAFIRPKQKPALPMAALDLTRSGTAKILDPVIALNRLGAAAGRVHSASVERISAIVEQPRRFYVPDANMTTATLGAPAFTADGQVLGVFAIRSAGTKGTGNLMDTPAESLTGIIVPADQILKAAAPVMAAGEAKESK
jgi:hypothetical protein